MSAGAQQFPYVAQNAAFGQSSLAPLLPLTISGQHAISTNGLVDSGASINVLGYSLGCRLGFDWALEKMSVQLGGNLASAPAKIIFASVVVGAFAPVQLAFAWSQSDDVSVLLGQVNFFVEFDVCFFRSRNIFEVRPRS